MVDAFRSQPDVTTLYKYFSPGVIEHVLAHRSLRFTQAAFLNDPFEAFPTMDAYLRPLLTSVLLQKLKDEHRSRMLAALEEHLGNRARNLGFPKMIDEELADETLDWVREMRRSISSALSRMSREERRSLLAKTRDRFNTSFGILCLTEKPDSMLMWSHYADSHRGFALELDVTDAFFDRRTFPNDPLRRIRKVQYQEARPARALFEPKYWLRSNKTASVDLDEYLAGLLSITKSSDWTYEQEWRMVIPLSLAKKMNEEVHVLELPPRCLRGVILGSEISEENRQRIAEILEQPDYMHVEIRRAVRDSQRFRVIIQDDESVLENRLLEDIGAFPGDGIQQRIGRLKVSGPRYYVAEGSLARKGLISSPSFDRAKQKKKLLDLTAAGRSRLAERRKAARLLEESRKSDRTRFVERLVAASPQQREKIIADRLAELAAGAEHETIEPEILAHFADLSDGDSEAAAWLYKHGDARIVEPLISLLRSEHDEELVWLQNPNEAAEMDEDEIEEIEGDAPVAYWMLGDQRAWGSAELRQLAAYVLGGIVTRIAAEEAIEPLIDALRDTDEDVRWYAADALGHLGSLRALPHLERLAKEDSDESSCGPVADAAREAIKRVRQAQKQGKPPR